ncbi:MAG: ATP-binding protein [Candidatus Hydrothermarchaeales archaeon]
MIKSNPFTPQSGWEPKVFGGRQEQIEGFNKAMKEAVTGRPNHMVILGEWGIGKTSLLKQFKKIVQGKGYLASFCSVGRFTERDTVQDGINLISEEMVRGFPKFGGIQSFFENLEAIGISIAGFGGQVAKKRVTLQPQTYLTEFLLEMWKQLNAKLAVVLVDDIQNFSGIAQVMDILRLVLSKDEIIQNTRYLFILSSTPDGWRFFLDKHDPIGRFFRKRESLDCLSKGETLQIIDDTLKDTGVSFSKNIKERIYTYTLGHPYELQVLCSNLYESQLQGKVDKAEWEQAFKQTLWELGKDYFDALYRKASSREETVLLTLVKAKTDLSITETVESVGAEYHDFPLKNVKHFLYRLEDKGLIRRTERKDFKILDPMFREYILLKNLIRGQN